MCASHVVHSYTNTVVIPKLYILRFEISVERGFLRTVQSTAVEFLAGHFVQNEAMGIQM